MHIAGGAHRLIQGCRPASRCGGLNLYQILLCLHRTLFIPQHKCVVPQGLDLQDNHRNSPVLAISASGSPRSSAWYSSPASQAEPMSSPSRYLLQNALGNPGPSGNNNPCGTSMTSRYRLMRPTSFFARMMTWLVGSFIIVSARPCVLHALRCVQIFHAALPQHLNKCCKNLCRSSPRHPPPGDGSPGKYLKPLPLYPA